MEWRITFSNTKVEAETMRPSLKDFKKRHCKIRMSKKNMNGFPLLMN